MQEERQPVTEPSMKELVSFFPGRRSSPLQPPPPPPAAAHQQVPRCWISVTKHFQPCQSECPPNKYYARGFCMPGHCHGQLFPYWVRQVSEAKSSRTKLKLDSCKSFYLSSCFLFWHLSVIRDHLRFGAWTRALGLFRCVSCEWSGDLSSVSLIIKLLWKRASA